MTNEQYQTLIGWIGEQPPGQTAEQLHAALHAPTQSRPVERPTTWAGIAGVLTDAEYDEAKAAAAWLSGLSARNADMMARLNGEWGLDLGHPDIRTALDAAVPFEQLSATVAAKIKAIAEVPCSEAYLLGLASAQVGNFASALNMMEAPQ